jgi:hypothetical protein
VYAVDDRERDTADKYLGLYNVDVTLTGGTRDGYPSAGVYSYDPSGDVIHIKTLYEARETTFRDLAAPMEINIPSSK